MTLAVFHDFPGLENGLTKFHDFPWLSRKSGHPAWHITAFHKFDILSDAQPKVSQISYTSTKLIIINNSVIKKLSYKVPKKQVNMHCSLSTNDPAAVINVLHHTQVAEWRENTLLKICPATLSNEQCISAEDHSFLVPNKCHTACPSKRNGTVLKNKKLEHQCTYQWQQETKPPSLQLQL